MPNLTFVDAISSVSDRHIRMAKAIPSLFWGSYGEDQWFHQQKCHLNSHGHPHDNYMRVFLGFW